MESLGIIYTWGILAAFISLLLLAFQVWYEGDDIDVLYCMRFIFGVFGSWITATVVTLLCLVSAYFQFEEWLDKVKNKLVIKGRKQ